MEKGILMRYFRFIQRLFFPMVTLCLAGDLLLLYFRGAWYDPMKLIEVSEVTCLFLFVVLGITQTVMEVKRFWRDEK